jgi:hypothetical protein
MKRFLSIIAITFLTCSTVLSTEQVADILIIGKDTFYLKTFPFDYLRIKHRMKEPPFYSDEESFDREYIATWHVIDGILVLKEIRKLNSAGTQLNIIEYLECNGYNPKIKDGFVIADWYSDTLVRYDFFRYDYVLKINGFYLSNYAREKDKRELVFENGELIENNIIPIEAYKIGDSLSLEVHCCQDWYVWYDCKEIRVKGIIRENNGEKVWLEIFSFGNDKKRIKRKVLKELKSDYILVNPRYCDRVE